MKRRRSPRSAETATPDNKRILRFPFLLGGNRAFRSQTARQRLDYLRGGAERTRVKRMISIDPPDVSRRQPFDVILRLPTGKKVAALARVQIIFPSGTRRELQCKPTRSDRARKQITLRGLASADAGTLCLGARLLHRRLDDVRCEADLAPFEEPGSTGDHAARVACVRQRRPCRVRLGHQRISLPGLRHDHERVGRCPHLSPLQRSRHRWRDRRHADQFVRVQRRPFTVQPGQSAYRTVDTWYPQGSSVWDKFNRRWDLTVQFTYESDAGVNIQDAAAYRPMSTVPLNAIKTTDFTAAQTTAQRNAMTIAAEIMEARRHVQRAQLSDSQSSSRQGPLWCHRHRLVHHQQLLGL